jgi:hypothetical protein
LPFCAPTPTLFFEISFAEKKTWEADKKDFKNNLFLLSDFYFLLCRRRSRHALNGAKTDEK